MSRLQVEPCLADYEASASGSDSTSSRLLRLRGEQLGGPTRQSPTCSVKDIVCGTSPKDMAAQGAQPQERVILNHLRPLEDPNVDPQPDTEVDHAVFCLLWRSLSHFEDTGSAVRIAVFE